MDYVMLRLAEERLVELRRDAQRDAMIRPCVIQARKLREAERKPRASESAGVARSALRLVRLTLRLPGG